MRRCRIKFAGAVTPLLCLSLSSCGVLSWRDLYVAKQPSGSGVLHVRELCGFPDCKVQVVISQGWDSRRGETYGGCNIRFVQAIWVGSRVVSYVDGSSQKIEFAYDLGTLRPVPFSSMQAALQAAIINSYNISPEELAPTQGKIFLGPYQTGIPTRVADEFRERYHP